MARALPQQDNYLLGIKYRDGDGCRADQTKALEFFKKAAGQGEIKAYTEIGLLYVDQDSDKAKQYFQMGANKGDLRGLYYLGTVFFSNDDVPTAIKHMETAANGGCTEAQLGLGELYRTDDSHFDYNKSMKYYQMAKNDPNGLMGIGYLYRDGKGVTTNISRAIEYFQAASNKCTSEKESAAGIYTIGEIFQEGLGGTPVDYVKALKFYQAAADKGSVRARTTIGHIFRHGKGGITQDCVKALKYYESAIDNTGDGPLISIGEIYENGEGGIPQDYLKALKYYQAHHDLGYTPYYIEKLKEKIEKETLAKKFSSISVSSGNNSRDLIESLKQVEYKGVIELVSGYTPPKRCHEHMQTDLPIVLPDVNMATIVRECIRIAESRLQRVPSGAKKLTVDQAVAIAAYSYDLSFSSNKDGEDNLFFVLNNVLRERNPQKMVKLKPFLSYLMTGLSELEPVAAVVYRGVPKSAYELVKEKYLDGSDVHWSAFNSTTTNLQTAKQFAQGSGGIIFRIRVLTGRNIKNYSAIPNEEEVLLSPNCRLVVTEPIHLNESDGFYYIHLTERREGHSFIF